MDKTKNSPDRRCAENETKDAPLSGMDLMSSESRLCASLSKFFSFTAHSFYFPRPDPQKPPKQRAEYLEREEKLLLPLWDSRKNFLGIFVARGVQATGMDRLLPLLPGIASLCLENISLFKQSLRDPVSGLFPRQQLLDDLATALEQSRETLHSDLSMPADSAALLATKSGANVPGQLSLMAIRLNKLSAAVKQHGYLRTDRLIRALAETLESVKPGQALAARSGDYELALLLPGLGAQACREIAPQIIAALNQTSLVNELTGRKIGISASIGQTSCPRDLDGMERQHPAEQARLLLRKSRLAAAVAEDCFNAAVYENNGQKASGALTAPVMSFSGILAEGGLVIQTGPLSRITVSLGKTAGARAGQRFAIWGYAFADSKDQSAAPQLVRHYKGEIILLEVSANESVAELVHSDDPLFLPQAGDRLTLLGASLWKQEDTARAGFALASAPKNKIPDPSGLLPYVDFMQRWCIERENCNGFSLVLARFGLHLPERASLDALTDPLTQEQETDDRQWEQLMAQAAERCRKAFGKPGFGGRFALNSLLFFVPESAGDDLAKKSAGLGNDLKKHLGLDSAFGISPYPFLNFRKADTVENTQKALEYALLLPEPHIGVLDTLALNISADRLFSLGDSLGAIEEYKLALLCDENNILARNSLGAILSGLGRHNDARRHFEAALKHCPDDMSTLYNLGNLCHLLGEYVEAAKFYNRCLELDAQNVYALCRLGQMSEQQANIPEARDIYAKAAKLPGGAALTRRSLARLAIKEGKLEEAREQLHEALLNNPHDALALQLLAGLYLDGGEDPKVAESLARQSVALRPDLKSAWLELVRALKLQGRWRDADLAMSEAMYL